MNLVSRVEFVLQLSHNELRVICLALAGRLPLEGTDREAAQELNRKILERRAQLAEEQLRIAAGALEKSKEENSGS